MEAALRFYCDGLGLKRKFTMTSLDGTKPWIEFLETGEHQFLELFYTDSDMSFLDRQKQTYGYQHLCLEVDDIQAMRTLVESKGIVPDTEDEFGLDYSWQFWLHDPDGNRVELMQYTDQSLELRGRL
jgi:catechol 2,3-dioxygenase-like lactoylglutathione lyase family enzyme